MTKPVANRGNTTNGRAENLCANEAKVRLHEPQCENNCEVACELNNDDGVFVNLVVPPGVEAGVDSLSFNYGGNELDVLVPDGSVEGNVLRIQVGVRSQNPGGGGDGAEDGDGAREEIKPPSNLMDELGGVNEDDENTLDNDIKKQGDLLSEMGGVIDEEYGSLVQTKCPQGRNFTRGATRSVGGITIVELGDGLLHGSAANDKQPVLLKLLESLPENSPAPASANYNEGDGTHGMVWASGSLLAQALTSSFGLQYLSKLLLFNTLHENVDEESHVQCLELGSGLGVCGISLAHALASFNATHSVKAVSGRVLLTDQVETAVDLLRENIKLNLPPSINKSIAIAAETLKWGKVLQSEHPNDKFQLIVGSDLLYNTQESYEPLIRTIKHYLHPDQGIVFFSVRWRKPELEREFFHKADIEGLKFELWKEFVEDTKLGKRSPCVLSWAEYGNPGCQLSNNYFHTTTVPISKIEIPLSRITEKDMEGMNDKEYSKFEELQVQIYVGKFVRAVTMPRKRKYENN